jgi:hypothetical protein
MAKQPPSRSHYDELHDKYIKILTTKAGTRYERLAAMVFKTLENKNAVIHDLELTGEDPEVKHQIDVTVEIGGTRRRVVIECKDFDISGEKVGLGIVRNFRSVIEDTNADEGIIVTCNGFTEDAAKYARSKAIKLVILRLFETIDMNGRITKIILGVTAQQPANPRADVYIGGEHLPRYQSELAAIGVTGGMRNTDRAYFIRGKERVQFNEFLTARMNDAIGPTGSKAIRIAVPADGWQVQIDRNDPIPFDGIIVNFDVDEESHSLEITSNRIAELVLSGFGGCDIIIFGDQIERRSINPDTGAVA